MDDKTRSDSALNSLNKYWGFIIGIIVGLGIAIASAKVNDIPSTGLGTVVIFLFSPTSHLIATISIGIVLPVVLNLIFVATRAIERKKPLRQYLRLVEIKNRDLKPTGFAQSEALLSVSVPLSENFIRLYATPDRPRYEISSGQAELIEQIRRNAHLSPDECEAQIQLLKRQWWHSLDDSQTGQNTEIADVLREMTPEKPIAVILGIPGSGKSTTMRWLALHMAQAKRYSLLQKSGKTLPHRRIELYDMVTRTLLANRNYETGRRYFSDSDLPLVDQVLSELAFQLHKSDFFLTKHEVNTIACKVMTEETKEAPDQTTVEKFTDTIRDSSGLFVEIRQGLFSFMHRTFQEYHVARYLLRQTPQYRKDFVKTHFTSAIWREPLLLAIASRSTENKAEAKAETKELIELIDQTSAPCDATNAVGKKEPSTCWPR